MRTRIDLIKIMQRRHDITKPNKAFIKDTEPSGGFNLKFYIRKMNIPFYPRQCKTFIPGPQIRDKGTIARDVRYQLYPGMRLTVKE